MRRRRRYHEPEDLGPEQDRRDAADPNRRYYVYVLGTDFGHYVGHTFHVGRRLREHQGGEVPSTAGGNPTLAWTSRPFRARADAASFEAAMKSLRDQRSPRFREMTGLAPIPFAHHPAKAPSRFAKRGQYPRRLFGRRRGSWPARFFRRELRGLFFSRRKRRMWGAIAVGVVLVVVYLNNAGGF